MLSGRGARHEGFWMRAAGKQERALCVLKEMRFPNDEVDRVLHYVAFLVSIV